MSTFRKCSLMITALAWAVVLNCQRQSPLTPERLDTEDGIASLSLAQLDALSTGLTRIVVTATGAGMDSIYKEIIPTAGLLRDTLRVKAGDRRIFTVTAFRNSSAVMAAGDSVNLAAGKTVNLRLKMTFLIPAITITPTEKAVAVNDTFSVYFKVHKADSLAGVGLRLLFPQDALQVVDLGREDVFLSSRGGTVWQFMFNRNNTSGEVNLVLGVLGSGKSVSGEGLVGRVCFKAIKATAAATLTLIADPAVNSNFGLMNNKGTVLDAFTIGGKVTAN